MNDLKTKINGLKKKKNAVILVHNYQLPEVQDIADFTGDSLGLSIQSSKTKADIIIFCGVYFMAETAKIINPQKKVVIPDKNAGCPMANMLNEKQLLRLKQKYPGYKVVCYVNSSAAIKAMSDICCTSANAEKVVRSLKDEKIIFIPDKSLGGYIKKITGKDDMVVYDGYCPTHHRILKEEVEKAKLAHPDALLLAHPECTEDVVELADEVLSTSGMLKFADASENKKFIIATESGILYSLSKQNPEKIFINPSRFNECNNMKLINLEKVLWALEDEEYEVEVEESVRKKAYEPIKKMLTIV